MIALKRHQQFWLEAEKNELKKWLKFITSKDICDWTRVSRNPNFTMKFIISHPEYNWNWHYVSRNPNVTMELIESHPKYNWDWDRV